jgi:mannose-6-phosphate isomerase-like protein (cupin superfamily)
MVSQRFFGSSVMHITGSESNIDTAHNWERPWGSWHVLHQEPGLKIKKLIVKPGQFLSVQYHEHRAEYWMVLAGIGRAILDRTATYYLEPADSLFVARGQIHQLINDGTVDLVIIESQVGDILKETDIVRIDPINVEVITRPNQSI